MQISNRVAELIEGMTLAEKVGQIFVLTWENEQQAINDLRLNPGGYIRIYSDAISVCRQTRLIQERTKIPLIIAADLERGIGGTIAGPLETITCMALGATGSEDVAYDAACIIAAEARAMGINMNYAPVVDVNSNPANPVINTRSFGGDPELVARLGAAFAKGLQETGVASCGKHFPGHGDTNVDSHSHLGGVSGSRAKLEKTELLPFRALIKAGVDSIMSAHLLVPALEPEAIPATLSRRIMTDLLRHELGFEGLAVSDALEMGAVAEHFSPKVAIPMAINAGCDQLIMPEDSEEAVSILLQSVKNGTVSEERIDEAVARVLTLKEKRGILDAALPDLSSLHLQISTPKHLSLAGQLAAQSITLVKDENVLPLRDNQKICCVSISNGTDGRAAFLEPYSFSDYLRKDNWSVKTCSLSPEANAELSWKIHCLPILQWADVVVIAAYVNVRLNSGNIGIPETILPLLQQFSSLKKPVILVSFGSPYLLKQLPEVNTYVCAYGATQPSQQAMANALKGHIPCLGTLPVKFV